MPFSARGSCGRTPGGQQLPDRLTPYRGGAVCELPPSPAHHIPRPRGTASMPGDDRHLATLPLAGALGDDTRVVPQFEMDDAALIGRHRLEDHRAVAFDCLVRYAARQLAQLSFAASAITFDVNDDGNLASQFLAYDQTREILQCGESLTPAPDQEAEIAAAYVDPQWSGLARLGLGIPARSHSRLDGHPLQQLQYDVAAGLQSLFFLLGERDLRRRDGRLQWNKRGHGPLADRKSDARLSAAQA